MVPSIIASTRQYILAANSTSAQGAACLTWSAVVEALGSIAIASGLAGHASVHAHVCTILAVHCEERSGGY